MPECWNRNEKKKRRGAWKFIWKQKIPWGLDYNHKFGIMGSRSCHIFNQNLYPQNVALSKAQKRRRLKCKTRLWRYKDPVVSRGGSFTLLSSDMLCSHHPTISTVWKVRRKNSYCLFFKIADSRAQHGRSLWWFYFTGTAGLRDLQS